MLLTYLFLSHQQPQIDPNATWLTVNQTERQLNGFVISRLSAESYCPCETHMLHNKRVHPRKRALCAHESAQLKKVFGVLQLHNKPPAGWLAGEACALVCVETRRLAKHCVWIIRLTGATPLSTLVCPTPHWERLNSSCGAAGLVLAVFVLRELDKQKA